MIALLSAMREEIHAVAQALTEVSVHERGGRHFHVGRFCGREVVVVFSRYGKVAAASTVTQLICAFPVSEVIFSGVAGGVQHGLAIGDVVVATALLQHDMDASPLFARYEVPLSGKSRFATDPALSMTLAAAAQDFLNQDLRSTVAAGEREFFSLTAPKVVRGLVASGDKFFASAADVADLRQRLPELVCVEMEGAAVAQVCDEYQVPYAIVRTISDSADENSVHDFPRFAREIAGQYSLGVLTRFMQRLTASPQARY